jgi:hypothetical protein
VSVQMTSPPSSVTEGFRVFRHRNGPLGQVLGMLGEMTPAQYEKRLTLMPFMPLKNPIFSVSEDNGASDS